jgi:hypothetical protein
MAPRLIKSADDLVTSVQATQHGFLKQALRKTKEAEPYVKQARNLQRTLAKVKSPFDLVNIEKIQNILLTACGFSDKSLGYFNNEERRSTLQKVLSVIAQQAGDTWRDELVYRYILTRGDSLGGAMRNIIGAEAGVLFAQSLQKAAKTKGIPNLLVKSKQNGKVQGLAWPNRVLFFDKAPVFLSEPGSQKNNIDAILLNSGISRPSKSLWDQERKFLGNPGNYLACGELKGGIDPAGADEHWKTAASALSRIRKRFDKKLPKLFFIGAAIVKAMAVEIFEQLNDGRLTYAANSTVQEQMDDLANWLISL